MAWSSRHVFTRFAFAAALASASPASHAFAQERDRAKIPDKYKWNLADIYPTEEAWRAAKDRIVAEIPELKSFRGTLGSSPARLADALEMMSRLDKELSRALRLRQHAVRPGHARSAAPGHAAGDDAARRRSSAPRPRYIEPEILKVEQGDDRQVRRRRAAAEALPLLPRRHRAPRARTR